MFLKRQLSIVKFVPEGDRSIFRDINHGQI